MRAASHPRLDEMAARDSVPYVVDWRVPPHHPPRDSGHHATPGSIKLPARGRAMIRYKNAYTFHLAGIITFFLGVVCFFIRTPSGGGAAAAAAGGLLLLAASIALEVAAWKASRCAHCGRHLAVGPRADRFCPECGTPSATA